MIGASGGRFIGAGLGGRFICEGGGGRFIEGGGGGGRLIEGVLLGL